MKPLAQFMAMTALASGLPAQAGPVAALTSGKVEGIAAAGVRVFRGIPYAAPPVGPLRWRAPARIASWKGIRPATTFGAACPQAISAPTQMSSLTRFSEDCLTLNVWAPQGASQARAVMVWLHGGGFFTGSGSEAQFDGTELAKRGVVVVTINYRLGRLGFFAHPALLKEAGSTPTGNFGLLDQVAALKWVQDNAAAFGGDRKHITVFGESAGGISIASLMTSPMAQGLFSKASIQSGAIAFPARSLADAAGNGKAWATSLGIAGDGTDALAALRGLPPDRIAPPSPNLADITAIQSTSRPIIDGTLVPKYPADVFADGEEAKIPLIIGSNGSESEVWLFDQGFGLFTIAPIDPAAVASPAPNGGTLADEYVAAAGGDRTLGLRRLASDLFVGNPTRSMAQEHARMAPTWLYRFDAVPTPARTVTRIAPHGTDLWYVFETLGTPRIHPEMVTKSDRAISEQMMEFWTRFAKSGRPANARIWPDFRHGGKLLFMSDGGFELHEENRPAIDHGSAR